ncbi:hypothetical protein PMAYCL1PPCAC_09490, partial [Pristionchus mayeri]
FNVTFLRDGRPPKRPTITMTAASSHATISSIQNSSEHEPLELERTVIESIREQIRQVAYFSCGCVMRRGEYIFEDAYESAEKEQDVVD